MAGRLILCATPIGNLDDASPRLAEALGGADVVFAEDTRRTATLLGHLGVRTPMRSFHAGNERPRLTELEQLLVDDQVVALVSDAGMPAVSDPGSAAVRVAVDVGAVVSAIPGPSAVTTAIAVAGFGGDRFRFVGFLERKGSARASDIEEIVQSEEPVVAFAAPSRVHRDLEALVDAGAGDRAVVVARELTKLHEEIWRGTVRDAADEFADERRRRGEFTLVVDAGVAPEPSLDDAVAAAQQRIAGGESRSQAVREVAAASGVRRRDLYERVVAGDR